MVIEAKWAESQLVHYQRIVVALAETISIMAAIDGVVEAFGGWPGALEGEGRTAGKATGPPKVAETRPGYEGERSTRESDR